MQQRLRELLSRAGLSEDEVRLYILLLKLGQATATELIAQSSMNRMTVYRTLKRLGDRGLLSTVSLNNKQYCYFPLTLHALIAHLEKEQKKMRKLQLALQGLDPLPPYIDADITDKGELIDVREGLDAFREEYLKLPDHCEDEFLCMGSMESYWRAAGMSDESPEEISFRNKRFRKNIYARVFNLPSLEAEIFSKRDSKEIRTTRIVKDLPVQKDYTGFASNYLCHFVCDEENPRVIVIRQPDLFNLHRKQFQSMWERGC